MEIPKETIEQYIKLHYRQFNQRLDVKTAETRLKQLARFYLFVCKQKPPKDLDRE